MTALSQEFGPGISTALRIAMKIKNFIIISVGILMALTFFFVVIFRYGFNADLFAYEEWLMAACFWMFFMASAAASHDRAHINADILGVVIKDPGLIWKRAVLVELIELIVLIAITYWAYLMVRDEIAAYPNWQATIALHIPFLVPRAGIFLGFVMMTIYVALHLFLLVKNGPGQATMSQEESGQGETS